MEEEITDEHGCDHTCEVGHQTTRHAVSVFLDAHTAEVDGEDVERGVGTSL